MFVEDIRTGSAGNNIYAIPQNTDVLISHQPPLGILDFADNQYYGDEDLLRKVHQVKPKFHLFGHVHTAYGIETHDSITFSNAALVNERYELLQVRLNCKRYYPYSPLNDLRYLP
jgi:Icc-related predicted phosphoesterase